MDRISAISLAGLTPPDPTPTGGKLPELRWISVYDLYVDLTYQREVLATGRRNILRIAAEFDWAFFTPVIVSPWEGTDFYLIIDGQHRATAAKLIGKTEVPCCVVQASKQKQALAFKSINMNVTRMHALQIHSAAVAAGDPSALFLETLVREGGARILKYPCELRRIKPRETMAVASIKGALRRFGHVNVVTALLAISNGPREYVGLLSREMIDGVLLALQPLNLSRDEACRRINAIDLNAIEKEAKRQQELRGGRREHLICELLSVKLREAQSLPIKRTAGARELT